MGIIYITAFEFFRKIQKLSNEDHEFEEFKTGIKKGAYSSFDNCKFWNQLHHSKEEHMTLKGLYSNKNINQG